MKAVDPAPATFESFLREAYRTLPEALENPSMGPAGHGGSVRTFVRIGQPPVSLVGMRSETPPSDERGVTENDSFRYLARHLREKGIPVPAILAEDPERGWFVLEDAGEVLLFDLALRRGVDGEPTQAPYRRAVETLALLQHEGASGFDLRRTHNPPYEPAFFREFESGYFQKRFVGEVLGMDPGFLDADLDRMAGAAGAHWTPHLLHRDYQSQNLTVREKGVMVLDFQGARLGPRQYDLAALLWDPYVELPAAFREELLSVYLAEAARWDRSLDEERFREGFPLIAAHRIMQALGAYGFLSRHRNKPNFARHIPAGIRRLKSLLERYSSLEAYPAWASLVEALPRMPLEMQRTLPLVEGRRR